MKPHSPFADFWERFRKDKLALTCLLFCFGLIVVAILLPLLPLKSPSDIQLAQQYQAPQSEFWLGTDGKGRDLLSRILWGSRVSIFVGMLASAVSLVIGMGYGGLAGLLGGRADNGMMRFVDLLYALPLIFVVIFLLTLLGEYRAELGSLGIERIHVFYLVIGLISWLTMSRVVRGQVLSLKQQGFIEAARALGASKTRILFFHLFPNVLPIALVYLSMTVPQVILLESFLSFLGLGIEPPAVSWGTLAADGIEALNPIHSFWWIALFPALIMALTLLALNRLGEGLRNALQPQEVGNR